jgi:hypothetical protein
MVGEDKASGSVGPAVGRFVTIVFKDAPSGLAFQLLDHDEQAIRLRPLRASGALPFGGERVSCRSSAGQWTTTVVSAVPGLVELSAPRWLSRPAQRRWRRIPLDASVTVVAGGSEWAGRLQDVSMQGAAVLLERSAQVRQGDTVALNVPGGTIRATVRSVRPRQRLLVVVGVSYERLEPAAIPWVAGVVAGRPGGPALDGSGAGP